MTITVNVETNQLKTTQTRALLTTEKKHKNTKSFKTQTKASNFVESNRISIKMELQGGFRLLWQQYKALLKKNLTLSWKSKRATFLQLFSSLFFIFLIYCIQEAIKARFATSTDFSIVRDPKALVSPSIPPCEDKFYVKLPCFDFVWSGNESARVRGIVGSIMENNPGRVIPQNKVWYSGFC